MKLNYKRTILVGFAFFLIMAFWQAYDAIVPKIMTDKFGLMQGVSGFIMALDNILALVLLPLFGAFSDKIKTRFGKRTPFIFVGTVIASVALVCLSFSDGMQLAKLNEISAMDETAMEVLYEADLDVKLDGAVSKISLKQALNENGVSREEFLGAKLFDETEIEGETKEELAVRERLGEIFTKYAVPARQAYAAKVTAADPTALILFMAILLILLLAMGIFRSPAVALMPDVTPKPLRSKGNAVINLMGSFGGISVLVLGMLFGTGAAANALMTYGLFFGVVSAIMVMALVVFVLFVREPQWVAEMEAEESSDTVEEQVAASGDRKLSRGEKTSLFLILASVILWYMGYNAVATKYSVYASTVLDLDYNTTLIVAQGAAIVSYIPVGIIASRIGRKKCILAGVVMLSAAFLAAMFTSQSTPLWVMNLLFALAGIGWATINVNSYPMVVELAKGSNVGKYTGFYYTASMSAQIVTPILSGFCMDISYQLLFPYSTLFVLASFFTMLFVKHGDSKPQARGVEALAGAED